MEGVIVLKPRMTADEVAEIANCTRQTILRCARRGELKGKARVGKAMTFSGPAVAKFLKRRGIDNVLLVSEVA